MEAEYVHIPEGCTKEEIEEIVNHFAKKRIWIRLTLNRQITATHVCLIVNCAK